MSKARLVITAVVVEGRSLREVARAYGVSQGWISRLVARFRREGEAAFEPRSRRPNHSPSAIPQATVELICQLRQELTSQGLDAGPDTIAWHLAQHHGIAVSRTSVSRYLDHAGLVVPDPAKRPRSSYIRFQADLPNECWQADFTQLPPDPARWLRRRRRRDPQLARRLLPLRPQRHRPPPRHRPPTP